MKLHSRSLVRLQGSTASSFLHGLVTQDVLAKVQENPTRSFAAGFLNAKGRVLCDTIVFPRANEEFLLDVHSSVAPSLMRLLLRHRLREPLNIELASEWSVVWDKDSVTGSSSSGKRARVGEHDDLRDEREDMDADPRNALLGRRRVAPTEEADALSAGDDAFFRRRIACGIPEGPEEIVSAKALPLSFNFDLNNFVSFRKGCYVGQELTHRSYHLGKIRKRVCRVVATETDFPFDMPIPDEVMDETNVLPLTRNAEENELCSPVGDDWQACGHIICSFANVGLAMFTTRHSLNDPEHVVERLQGSAFFRGKKLLVKPPLL